MESSDSQTNCTMELPWEIFSSTEAWLPTSRGSNWVDLGEQISICFDMAFEYLLDLSSVSE